jgi:hypothetical protein
MKKNSSLIIAAVMILLQACGDTSNTSLAYDFHESMATVADKFNAQIDSISISHKNLNKVADKATYLNTATALLTVCDTFTNAINALEVPKLQHAQRYKEKTLEVVRILKTSLSQTIATLKATDILAIVEGMKKARTAKAELIVAIQEQEETMSVYAKFYGVRIRGSLHNQISSFIE